MESSVLPSPQVVRERIESIPREDIRMCLKAIYLYDGRVSEVVGKASPKDATKGRGPTSKDVTPQIFHQGKGRRNEQAIVFTVRTAKRGGRERYVALPPKFEPWSIQLSDYYRRFEQGLVFPFTRQTLGMKLKEFRTFAGLTYRIYSYNLWVNGKIEKVLLDHDRPFAPHAIRHLRASELAERYGFDGIDLAMYGGWTMKTATGIGSLDRYLSLGWQRYFPKLLQGR